MGTMTRIDQELLEVLACPLSHAPLVQAGDWLYSTDLETRRRYPIRDGIPVLLVEEAETVGADDLERIIADAKGLDEPDGD